MMKPLHAYVSGMMLALAQKHGLDVEPVLTAHGDYTNRFEVKSPEFPANVRVFLNIEEPLVEVSETNPVDHDELDRLDAAIASLDADERDGMGHSPATSAAMQAVTDGWADPESEVPC